MATLTSAQLKAIVPTLKDQTKLDTYTAALNEAMTKFNITEPAIQAMFLAQVAHESGGFFYFEEIASGKAYEGRKDLGNTQSGDGVKFKGRGWIQITGRTNYTDVSKALGIDAVANPTILAKLPYAGLSAGWFWNNKKINDIAKPGTDAAFLAVTKKINGGTNGLDDRRNYWARAKKALGVN
ncbi:Chitinase class I [compost metagenome]